jgi:hypothetical protein
VRRFYNIFALLLVAFWLPATLRCEIETVPGLEFFGCETPCNGVTDKSCTDGCAVLEGGLFKISNDEVKAPVPSENDLCLCAACSLCSALRAPDPATDVVVHRGGDEDARARTWHFVRRAAPPSRAPSV